MVDSNYNNQAEQYMKKGDKKYKGSFFGNIFTSKSERVDEALELYKQAATQYKLAKNWEDACKAYIRCADCQKAIQSNDAADSLVDAGNMIKKINTAECIKYFEEAIQIYCNENRIGYAAKLKRQIGEIYEQDQEFSLAAKAYKEASELFYAENDSTSDYNNMRLKVADLNTQKVETEYVESIRIYEEVADKYLENKLTEPSAKNLYFKAILLYLVNDDSVGANVKLEKYSDKSPSFQGTRQFKFLQAIINAVNGNNIQQFSQECYDYNTIIPLDKWQTQILNKIKDKMNKPIYEVDATDKKEDFL